MTNNGINVKVSPKTHEELISFKFYSKAKSLDEIISTALKLLKKRK